MLAHIYIVANLFILNVAPKIHVFPTIGLLEPHFLKIKILKKQLKLVIVFFNSYKF